MGEKKLNKNNKKKSNGALDLKCSIVAPILAWLWLCGAE